jgi:hypothetical protein
VTCTDEVFGRGRVGIKIENLPTTLHSGGHVAEVGQRQPHRCLAMPSCLWHPAELHGGVSGTALQPHGPVVAVPVDDLDAGKSASAQPTQQRT